MIRNRQDLLELVRLRLGGTATPRAAQLALEAVLQAMRDGITETGELRLAHFGTFKAQTRAPRKLLLPRSGKTHLLPERTVITFRQNRPAH